MPAERRAPRRERPGPQALFTEVQWMRHPLLQGSLAVSALVSAAILAGLALRGAISPAALTGLAGGVLGLHLVLVLAFWFASMTTEVGADGLWITCLLPWSRHFTLEDLAEARPETYHPVREFGGWGYRVTWSGKRVYSVLGSRGVRLIFTDGREVMIGSRRPEELARAIGRVVCLRGRRRP
ncbi:MAG: hypothetical protein HUU25_10805 [Candidatus Sumerlaeia bacterium]|nr:hypothetical protein [Candidatus Sumerlaeia bacterium]